MYIIAGCNGAGKTTAAYNLLPGVFAAVEFVNADEIARGLSPFNVEGAAFQAGRIMLDRIQDLIERNISFAIETTLSGRTYLEFIRQAKANGYTIIFLFIYLASIELANKRVAVRVTKGGHFIPPDVVSRRYIKGLNNFPIFARLSDDWYLFDNSGSEYKLVAAKVNNSEEINNFDLYSKILQYGGKG